MAKLNIEDEMTRAKRGIIWARLEESISGSRCPVCVEVGKSEAHYLESMLYEYVLDAGVRRKLHHSYGMCTRHAAMALATERRLSSDGLHLATMYESVIDEGLHILQTQIAEMKEIADGKKGRKGNRTIRTAHASRCFVCDFAADAETGALHNVVYFSRDPEFVEKYAASKAVICFKHIQMLVKEKAAPEVLAETVRKIGRLKAVMSQFIGKHDYQSAHDYSAEELRSHEVAAEFFAGELRY